MQMSISGSFTTSIGVALVAGGTLCLACVTEDEDPANGGTGGDGGATAETGGTGTAGPDTGSGGETTAGGATAETGGTETAGAETGGGGETTTGGADATDDGEAEAVACDPIADPLLTDFTYDPEGADDQATFGLPGESFAGGTLQYPDTLVSDVAGDEWHLSGSVNEYSGFGFYFQDGCAQVDASAYRGIHFTVSAQNTHDPGRHPAVIIDRGHMIRF